MSPTAVVHVEVVLEACNTLSHGRIAALIQTLLLDLDEVKPGIKFVPTDFSEESPLQGAVRYIQLCDACRYNSPALHPTAVDCVFHIYTPDSGGAAPEIGNCGEDSTAPSTHWTLPSEDFLGLWESLVFESDVKGQLLRAVETAALFAARGVDTNIINWNNVVLLHGPPGTGKTSLCRALAQKLSIRLDSKYRRAQLVEINSHSLFSKWFSESGKLVMKMFDQIKALAEDPDVLVCVLIDEVESLTHARKAAMNGVEPSDSIRVVNAVLTQIDQMQRFPNVLTLTTSNMTGAIDLAFVDRADIELYIGLPSVQVVYQIYYGCLNELMNKAILSRTHLFTFQSLERCNYTSSGATENSLKLLNIAKKSAGLSGRSLRKIPILAHCICAHNFPGGAQVTLSEFLKAMERAVYEKKGAASTDCLEKTLQNSVRIVQNGDADN